MAMTFLSDPPSSDANYVCRSVETEGFRGEFLLDESGDFRVAEGYGKGGGLALRYLLGEARARERADGEQKPGRLEGFRKNLGHAVEGAIFKALCGTDDELADAKVRTDAEQCGAQELGGMTETTVSAAVMAARSAVTVTADGMGKPGRNWVFSWASMIWRASSGVCAQRVSSWPPRRWSESARSGSQAPALRWRCGSCWLLGSESVFRAGKQAPDVLVVLDDDEQ